MTSRLHNHLRSILFRSLRVVFRLTPMGESVRDRLRQRFLDRFQGMIPQGLRGKTGTATLMRRARTRSDQPALGYVARRHEPLPSPLPATLVAFYLPQFHAIAENDAWWGKGFTEWRNVARALPQFEGHAQPRLPSDLGYYDLRNPETMREQAALAREYGIGAFCFYFYWFDGKTLLEAPLEQWLQDHSIELSFCLCWVNENWSRRWDGRADDVLIGQEHSAEDDLAFIAHVACYLRDPRYLRVDGKPLLLVYRPGLLPDAKATAARWHEWCARNGLGEIFIAYVQGFERSDPRELGFDATVEFPPNLSTPTNITGDQRQLNPDFQGQVLDWREMARDYSHRPLPAYRLFPGVNCGWDNEPRRPGQGRIYLHASPRSYRDWLHRTIEFRLAGKPVSDRLVFINAWNEWAEGAVLEPDARLGHAWLQATRHALQHAAKSHLPQTLRPSRPCVVVHAWYLDTFDEILVALQACGLQFRLVVTTTSEKTAQVDALLSARGMAADIEIVENRGRDILPFLRVANGLLDEDEELVLKLHTKRSPHLSNGQQWQRELVDSLLSATRASRILDSLQHDALLGLVTPDGHLLQLDDFKGGNKDHIDYLLARLGIAQLPRERSAFVSGSMFWARLNALRPLLDAHLDQWEFEDEGGQVDSTMAHGIERIFALCASDAGYRISSAAAVCGEDEANVPRSYAYAKRS